MWIDIIIILLCIQATVFTRHVASNLKINKEEQNEIYASQDETPLEDREIEQNDSSKSDYGSDEADTSVSEANSIQNEDPEDDRQHLNSPRDRSHAVETEGGNSPDKVLVGSNYVDSDDKDDEEPEDQESNADNEVREEIDLNDDLQTVEEGKNRLQRIDRSKRLTNASSSSDSSENTYDNSVNDNDSDDYGGKESSLEEEITTSRKMNAERFTLLQRITLPILFSEDTTVQSNRYNHDIKSKFGKNNTSVTLKKKYNYDTSHQDISAELNKAYLSLVCAVERFMSLANKTNKKLDKSDECVTTAGCADISATHETIATTCNSKKAAFPFQTSEDNIGNFLFSQMECTTKITADKGESTIICDKSDTEPVHRKLLNGDFKSNNKKKQSKPIRKEYEDVPGQGSIYVYNDYDSVDPNQEFTEMVGKPSLIPTAHMKHPKLGPSTVSVTIKESDRSFLKRNSWKNRIKSDERIAEKQSVHQTGRPHVQLEGITVETSKPFTAIFATKLNIRHSRKQKSKGTKMSSFVGKMRSRKKPIRNLYHEDQVMKENIPNVYTNYPTSTGSQHEKKEETEIIELEYE